MRVKTILSKIWFVYYTIVSALDEETSLSVTLDRLDGEFPNESLLLLKKFLSSSTFSNPFLHNSITLLLFSLSRSLTVSNLIFSVSVKWRGRWRGHRRRFMSLYNQCLGSGRCGRRQIERCTAGHLADQFRSGHTDGNMDFQWFHDIYHQNPKGNRPDLCLLYSLDWYILLVTLSVSLV